MSPTRINEQDQPELTPESLLTITFINAENERLLIAVLTRPDRSHDGEGYLLAIRDWLGSAGRFGTADQFSKLMSGSNFIEVAIRGMALLVPSGKPVEDPHTAHSLVEAMMKNSGARIRVLLEIPPHSPAITGPIRPLVDALDAVKQAPGVVRQWALDSDGLLQYNRELSYAALALIPTADRESLLYRKPLPGPLGPYEFINVYETRFLEQVGPSGIPANDTAPQLSEAELDSKCADIALVALAEVDKTSDPYQRLVLMDRLVKGGLLEPVFDRMIETASEIRESGGTWVSIGRRLGVSPQAAQNRLRRESRERHAERQRRQRNP